MLALKNKKQALKISTDPARIRSAPRPSNKGGSLSKIRCSAVLGGGVEKASRRADKTVIKQKLRNLLDLLVHPFVVLFIVLKTYAGIVAIHLLHPRLFFM